MYVIIKENANYYSATINMDSVVDVTIDRGGSRNTEYRLLFIFNCSADGENHYAYEFKTKTKAVEQLTKIQNAIKMKKRYVELQF